MSLFNLPIFQVSYRDRMRTLYEQGNKMAEYLPWKMTQAQWHGNPEICRQAYLAWIFERNEEWLNLCLKRFPETYPAIPHNQDDSRERGLEFAIMFALLRELLTSTMRETMKQRLVHWGMCMMGRGTPGHTTTLYDSDEETANFFALRAIQELTDVEFDKMLPGQDSIAMTLMEQRIKGSISRSQGGVWIEGENAYNLGTLQHLLMGSKATEWSEDTAEFFEDVGQHLVWSVTPDFKDMVQYGDIQQENAYNPILHHRLPLMMLIHALDHDPDAEVLQVIGAFLRKLERETDAWWKPYYAFDGNFHRPWWFGFDPRGFDWAGANITPKPMGVRAAPGMGLTIVRGLDWLGQFHICNTTNADHEPRYFDHHRIYYKGHWVVDDPARFYQPHADWHNTSLVAGLGAEISGVPAWYAKMWDTRWLSSEGGVNAPVRIKGISRGQYYPPEYGARPASFITRWEVDFVIVSQLRFSSLYNFEGNWPSEEDLGYFRETDRRRILNSNGKLWQIVRWAPNPPRPIDGGWQYQSVQGVPVRMALPSTIDQSGLTMDFTTRQFADRVWYKMVWASNQPKWNPELITQIEQFEFDTVPDPVEPPPLPDPEEPKLLGRFEDEDGSLISVYEDCLIIQSKVVLKRVVD